MLKVLLKKQLQEILSHLMRGSKRGQRGKNGKLSTGAGMGLIWLLAIAYLVYIFSYMADSLATPLFEAGVPWLYYLLCGGIAVLLGTFGSVFNTYSTLYLAKDNDLLLSMPIPIRSLIISRLLGVFITGFGYSAIVSMPAVAVGWICGNVTLQTVLGGILFVLLISLMVLALSCLLGWVVARISLRLKNKSYITVLISLMGVGLYYYVYFKVMGQVDDLLENVISIGGRIRSDLYPIYLLGRIGEGDLLAMPIWTATVLVILLGIWFLLKSSFLSVATSAPAGKRAVYRERPTRQRTVSSALLQKELRRFISSSNYMLNCGIGLVFMVASGVMFLIKGRDLLDLLSLAEFIDSSPNDGIAVLLAAMCCLMQSMVYISAPSVSLEGKTIWQIQCLPVTPWQSLQAKLSLHLALTAVPTLFILLCVLLLMTATVAQKLLIVLTVTLFALLTALLGLTLNLLMPNLDWTNEIRPIKQGAAVMCTLFSGIALSSALGGLYFWFGWKLGATGYLGLVALLLATADSALALWLRHSGARRFRALG